MRGKHNSSNDAMAMGPLPGNSPGPAFDHFFLSRERLPVDIFVIVES